MGGNTSLFGSTQNTFGQNKPNTFGQTQPAPKTGFNFGSSTLGTTQPLFSTSINPTTTTPATSTTTTPGMSFGNSNLASSNLNFGTSNLGLGLGSNQSTFSTQNQQPGLQTNIDQNPYGQNQALNSILFSSSTSNGFFLKINFEINFSLKKKINNS